MGAKRKSRAKKRKEDPSSAKWTALECIPLWMLRNSQVSIYCGFCVRNRKRCSLDEYDLHISHYPKVVQTSKTRAERKEQADKKRASVGKHTESKLSHVKDGKGKGREVLVGSATRSTSTGVATSSTPVSAGSTLAANIVIALGREFMVENLAPFETLLNSTPPSTVSFWEAKASLQRIQENEEQAVASLRSFVEARRELIEYLLSELDRKMPPLLEEEDETERADEDEVELVEEESQEEEILSSSTGVIESDDEDGSVEVESSESSSE